MKNYAKSDGRQIVLLIHGIRTRAWWQGEVKGLVEDATGATVIPLKYGSFDLFRFWCPFGVCRQGPINRLHKDLRNAISQFGDRPISVIAHSYGTYALSRILLEHDDIKLHRIILCGSIIPNSFPWARMANQFDTKEMRTAVVNDCGTKDIWPVLATSTSWGYGSSGTHGFGSVQVTDRIHAMSHSGYFNYAFVKKYWLPFLATGEIISSSVERAGTGTPWWFQLLELPYKWAAVAAATFVVTSGLWTFALPFEAKQWACTAIANRGISACGDINAGDITISGQAPSQVNQPSSSESGSVISNGGVAAGGNIKAGNIVIDNSTTTNSQSVTINGDNNTSPPQIMTVPAKPSAAQPNEKSSSITGTGNQIIQEKIE